VCAPSLHPRSVQSLALDSIKAELRRIAATLPDALAAPLVIAATGSPHSPARLPVAAPLPASEVGAPSTRAPSTAAGLPSPLQRPSSGLDAVTTKLGVPPPATASLPAINLNDHAAVAVGGIPTSGTPDGWSLGVHDAHGVAGLNGDAGRLSLADLATAPGPPAPATTTKQGGVETHQADDKEGLNHCG